MLRHGQSEWNAAGRWQGQADIDLTDLGHEQARRATERLGMFDAVASSDLRRARTTARIIAEGLGIGLLDPDPRFRETNVGEWEGLTHEEIEAGWPGFIHSHRRPPGFEPDDVLVARVSSALADLADAFPGGEVLCIAHAGVMRVMRRHLGVPDVRIANLGGCEFRVPPRGSSSLEIGDIVDLFEHGPVGEEL